MTELIALLLKNILPSVSTDGAYAFIILWDFSPITTINFKWQDDYFAVSVSESKLASVIRYIENQEDHHRYKSFSEEYDKFIEYFNKSNKLSKLIVILCG